MYVIFPLDHLLDLDSADKITRTNTTQNHTGVQSSNATGVLTPSHPVLHKQLPTTPEDQVPVLSATPSAQGQGQKPSHSQEKLSKGNTPAVKTPSALPSSPPIAQPFQHLPPTLSGTKPSSTSSNSGPLNQGRQRPTSLLQPDTHLSPKRKNASACASWAGPPPALETSPEITRSASFFLYRESPSIVKKQIPTSANIIDRSASLRQPPVTKSEISRNDIIKSESFRYNREIDYVEKPKSKQSSKKRPPIPAEFKQEQVQEVRDRKNELRRGFNTEDGREVKNVHRSDSNRQDFAKPELFPFGEYESEVIGSEVVGSENSAKSRGSSSSTSRSRGSSSLGKVVPTKSYKTLPTPTYPTAAQPRQPSPLRNPQKIAMSSEPSFKDLSYPALNESLKSYNSVSFKLIKTVSEFSAQLSRLHERHAEDLQLLVENYRKKHSDLRNERPQCASQIFQAWETLLQEVEVDSQLHSDVAGTFVRQVSRPLIEKTFHRKLQSRKLFTHRESIETILGKTEDMLKKCRKEHTEAYHNHCKTQSNASLASYFDAHNAYVQQLHATNAMLQYYNLHTQPELLQELEEVHLDVNAIILDGITQGADILAIKAQEQFRRYEGLGATCRNSDARADVVALVKHLDTPGHKGIPQHRFVLPQPPPPPEGEEELQVPEIPSFPPLRNELVLDRLAALSSRTRSESLKREANELDKQIAQLQEGMDALVRGQLRNLESCLYHKANELQEDISMKRFDLRVNQVHLAAVKAQRELFASKEGPSTESRERKMSGASTGSMKSKWMKAFKSLKTTGSSSGSGPTGGATSRDPDKKNGRDRGLESPAALFENSHILQEYTYKKITACDVCHQILRGHSRQGLKCRLCKTNVHVECQERLQRCQPKSRLLRRQRSTSEIESKQMDPGDEENEPTISINSLIASQPGRRMKDPPSPSTPCPNSPQFPLPPKGGQAPSNSASIPE